MRLSSLNTSSIAAALALLGSSSAALAGFTYIEDIRVVRADVSAEAGQGDSDVVAAPEFQRQSQLDADASFFDDFRELQASASQTSRLVAAPGSDEVLLLASGNLATGAFPGVAGASTRVDVSFEVDETTSYSLDLIATFTSSTFRLADDRGRLTLKRLVEGDPDGETLTTFGLAIDDLIDSDGLNFNTSGDLAPGRYAIEFELFARAIAEEGSDIGSYQLTFDPDATLGTAAPIPLPPAAWAGVSTLALYGGSRLLAGRVRRA